MLILTHTEVTNTNTDITQKYITVNAKLMNEKIHGLIQDETEIINYDKNCLTNINNNSLCQDINS